MLKNFVKKVRFFFVFSSKFVFMGGDDFFFGKNKVSAKLSVLKNGHFSFCPSIGITAGPPPTVIFSEQIEKLQNNFDTLVTFIPGEQSNAYSRTNAKVSVFQNGQFSGHFIFQKTIFFFRPQNRLLLLKKMFFPQNFQKFWEKK